MWLGGGRISAMRRGCWFGLGLLWKGCPSDRAGVRSMYAEWYARTTTQTEHVRRIVEPWERAGPDVPVSCCVSIRGESRIRFNHA